MLEPQIITNTEIFHCLEQGANLLTGNLRLSRFLGKNFEQYITKSDQAVWLTPVIMPLQNWLEQVRETLLIKSTLDAEIVLNPQQETLLWEDVIRHSMEGEALLRPHATARQAQQAWQLLHAWRLENATDVHGLNEDARAFQSWCTQFRARCRDNRWISSAQVPDQLASAFAKDNPFIGKTILLAGFDELTPQQQHLFAVLNDAGSEIRWVVPEANKESRDTENMLVECADERDEIRCMARWVRQRLSVNVETSIAVVVPDLEHRRATIMHELSSRLSANSSPLFNISLGLSLSQYPLVQTAFHLLAFMRQRIDLATARALLLSPFLAGWETESRQRALLDMRLRETGEPEVSLKTLAYFSIQETQPWYCPVLAEHVCGLNNFISSLPARDHVGHWAEQFSRYLKTAGWSSGRSLSSEEYQTLGAWQKLLVAFSRLDLISEPMSAQQALGHLRQLASEQTFQPESDDAPVQVLGLYEASGLHFDALWLMGMSDNIWPAAARPNPFISLVLQRQYEMPHATATRELAVARNLTRRLLSSAETIVVSYPLSGTGSGASAETLRPSTLFNKLPRSHPELWQGESWLDLIRQQRELVLLVDDTAPAIDLQSEKIHGGSSILRLQSNCPFRAFAELRLGARPFAQIDIGLDAMSRGTLVHRVLELVWDTLETQDCLLCLNGDALYKLVKDMIHVAIRETQQQLPQQFAGEYLKLESERLQGFIISWLEIEKQRAPFSVLETEQLLETQISGVPIRLKLDRVDELEDGRYLVIDYKSGKVTASQWFGDRPEEPQLPLYASVVEQRLAGILFAQLHAEKLGFKGISEEADLVPEVKSYQDMKQTRGNPSWSAVLANWKTTVEKLAEDFRAGIANVDPLKPGETCRYCELSTLCRIHEQNRLQEQAKEAEL